MSIFRDQTAAKQPPSPASETREPARFDSAPKFEPAPIPAAAPVARSEPTQARKESLIAADITVEGKIEGAGSVRIAGKFKGDVNVQGDLTIEPGAKLTGGVRADKVVIAGELEGNIEDASRVELLQTGVVIGDVKAGSLTVAAGARMRGHADFGNADDKTSKPGKTLSNGNHVETGLSS
jgi:cytoskeletal protein CcmA (bactofilin family)